MAGRAEHPSHADVIGILRRRFGDERFSLLDCGVMSGVVFSDLRVSDLNVDYTGVDVSDSNSGELSAEAS